MNRNAVPMRLAVAVWTCIGSAAVWSQTPETVPITLASGITHVQPMTGIVLWNDHEKVATDSIALEYRYVGYDEVVTAEGQFDFTDMDRWLDEIASRGHQAVLRFHYVYPGRKTRVPEFIRQADGYSETIGKSEGETTHFCDWSHPGLQQFTLDFYTRIAERYDADPRLAFLQTGFGLWAEYHIYDGPVTLGKTFPDKAYQTRFLKHMNATFKQLPWSISVDAADNDYTPLEDNAELLALNFGVFDDSFLCKPHPRVNAVNWKTLSPDRWQRAPAGGEFSYYNKKDQRGALAANGPNGVSFADAARQFHITYMIGSDQPSYQSMQTIAAAGMATGYRFVVETAARRGSTIALKVTNDGVAPIYRDAYFAAGEHRSTQSLRGLLPSESRIVRIEGTSPDDDGSIRIVCDHLVPGQKIQFATR